MFTWCPLKFARMSWLWPPESEVCLDDLLSSVVEPRKQIPLLLFDPTRRNSEEVEKSFLHLTANFVFA
jgi:hypothetical protein